MGNECLASTPNQKYDHYLKQIKVSQLKDLWQTVKIYKLKKIFDAAAIPNPNNPKETYLDFQAFKRLFVQLQSYPEQQLYRLYQIFRFQNSSYVDWNSFFSVITMLYFGSENNLALIMFMMFDHSLELKLDKSYLKLMLQTNEQYFKANEKGLPQDASQVSTEIINQEGLSIQNWLRKAGKFVDFCKYRKAFNIFAEQKMQKELVHNFYLWNQIYNFQRDKYIGYLINLKWFQSWRLYISHQYNISLDIYSNTKSTIKTVKTSKKVTAKLRTVKLGIDSSKALHGCRIIEVPNSKEQTIKNIDCIHNHLGERPREITNNELQGEYQQVLRQGLSQNMDYAIVSQKVWTYLKNIYDGFPEFRRTGFDSIELYPKIVKTYFSLFKGHIDYSTEVIRQVSAYLGVDQLLMNSCQLKEEDLKSRTIYFKTIGMKDWQELQDYSYAFTELSSNILIFLVCIPTTEKQIFLKAHKKMPKDSTQVNLGDYLHYQDGKGQQKTAVFMGKNTEGKYILHFVGELYTNDLCLIESDLLKYCKLSTKIQQIQHEKHINHNHSNQVGLPSGPGLSFINSTLQILMNSKDVKGQLLMMDNCPCNKLIYCLARIYSLLSKQVKIDPSEIKDLVEVYLNKYYDFQVGMSYDFITDLFSHLSSQIKEEQLPNLLGKHQIENEKHIECKHCNTKMTHNEQLWALRVPIPQDETHYYQVVWVPADLASSPINRYKVQMKKQATLNDFMNAVQQTIGIKENTFILTEVHNFDIVKNYHTAQRSATLKHLKMRATDQFFVYQLKTDLKEFVHSHYNTKVSLDDKEIKKDMFIDCKHPDKGWIFGKVMQIETNQFVNCSIVTVLHKFNKNESWEINYDVFDESVSRFPHKSHNNCEQYHLRVHQRIFNQASNSMKLISIPLIIVLPSWMRWKQFFYLVYLQIKAFIALQYAMPETKMDLSKNNLRLKKDAKFDPYKQYKNSTKFPYKLHLVDFEGRCVICFKFVKLVVFKGQNDTYCEGCQLSQSEPISWQVKPADLLVCIDWHGKDRYVSQINDSILNSKSQQSKKDMVTLINCLQNMASPQVQADSLLCCNVFSQKAITQKISKSSDILTIYLDRIVQEEDGFKKVIKKQVKFPTKQLALQQQRYKLIAMTSISGEHLNIKHKTYLLKGQQEWYEYDGKLVRVVNSKYVEKVCAFVLYYQKAK